MKNTLDELIKRALKSTCGGDCLTDNDCICFGENDWTAPGEEFYKKEDCPHYDSMCFECKRSMEKTYNN